MINRYWQFISISLRAFFRLLYGPFSWSYDWVAGLVSLGRWRAWVLSALPYLPGPAVLELGFGTGHLLRALSDRQIFVVGLDSSWQMVRRFCSQGRKGGFKADVVNGYAQFMPFSSGTFDQIAATFPSDYAWDPQTLQEIYRLLRPNGLLVLLPVAWITGSSPLDRLARLLFLFTGQAPPLEDNTLTMQLQTLLETEGFSARAERLHLETSQVQ